MSSAAPDAASLELPAAVAALEHGVQEGWHYGAQLSVWWRGRHADVRIGEAEAGVAMTPEHVLCWSSSVKPVMSVALGLLHERGLLSFHDPVAKHLPAFGEHGKGGITIAHCLTHMAGLWGAARGVPDGASPAQVAEHIGRQRLPAGWEHPGKRCGYDSPAWYVLAAVVSAVDAAGRPYERFCEEEIFGPLGMTSSSVGMSSQWYESLRAARLLAPIDVAPAVGAGAAAWKPIPGEEEPERVRYACPAGNGRGTARDLANFYAALLPRGGAEAEPATASAASPAQPDGVAAAPGAEQGRRMRLLREETVELITRTAREGIYDELQGVDTAWSLGFALRCILSGRHASAGAFGHGGSQSSFGFADPEHGLAVACLCNGKPGPELHYRRVGAVSTAIYEDLGLAPKGGSGRSFKLPGGLGTF